MDEDGTATPGNARPGILVDLDDYIVEPVSTPQPVAGLLRRPPERLVVAAISRVLTPGVGGRDPADRQRCSRLRQAIGPPPQPERMETAYRRRAVPLTLIGLNAATAERDRDCARTGNEQTQ